MSVVPLFSTSKLYNKSKEDVAINSADRFMMQDNMFQNNLLRIPLLRSKTPLTSNKVYKTDQLNTILTEAGFRSRQSTNGEDISSAITFALCYSKNKITKDLIVFIKVKVLTIKEASTNIIFTLNQYSPSISNSLYSDSSLIVGAIATNEKKWTDIFDWDTKIESGEYVI